MLYGYLRCSTGQQADSGLGIAAQRSACLAYADGRKIVFFEDLGVSGATRIEKRPALVQLLSSIEKGDTLVVAKRDRLGRDNLCIAMIEADIKKVGATIISCAGEGTESNLPEAVMMRRFVDMFAEYERSVISARTKAALRAKKAKGEVIGSHTPIGTQRDGKMLVVNPEEQQMVQLALSMHNEGKSFQKVADALSKMGYVNRDGNPLSRQNVFMMCRHKTT